MVGIAIKSFFFYQAAGVTLFENLGIGEKTIRTCHVTLTENLGCGESLKKVVSIYPSENLNLEESIKISRLIRLTETLHLGEQIVKQGTFYKTFSDSMGLGDEVTSTTGITLRSVYIKLLEIERKIDNEAKRDIEIDLGSGGIIFKI